MAKAHGQRDPANHRSYMDTRPWVMDFSRRFDGSVGIAGMTDRYDVYDWLAELEDK